eukprot:3607817-Alexandrium_andersonii.AAC.1
MTAWPVRQGRKLSETKPANRWSRLVSGSHAWLPPPTDLDGALLRKALVASSPKTGMSKR